MTHIVVTGASGFVGTHTVEALAETGRTEILAADIVAPSVPASTNVRTLQGDVQDFSRLTQLMEGAEGIIHLAGWSRLGDGFRKPYECMLANTLGSLNVLEAARRSPAHPWVLLGSTREVQDVRLPSDRMLFQNARGMYGLSKLCGELLAERYALDYSLRVLALRFSDVYGSIRDNLDRVLPKLLLTALRGGEISVVDSSNGHDFTHFSDVMVAIAKGVDAVSKARAPYYDVATICTGQETKLPELANLIVQTAGSSSVIRVVPPSPDDAIRSSPLLNDTDRARRILGFTAKVGLRAGLIETIAQYRSLIPSTHISR